MNVLGIDTSNYTTSVALADETSFRHARRILSVGHGERGLRQSNALFLHTKNLPEIIAELSPMEKPDAVAVSDRPRDEEGSYMPCFLAGVSAAGVAAAALDVPLFTFSHQAGHIEAAVRTCEKPDIASGLFLCYHVSGGTSELLLVNSSRERGYDVKIVGGTLDISAGQLIDRAGVLLGLDFPCGGELEKLAAGGKYDVKTKISQTGAFCNFSGAENIIIKMKDGGEPPCDIAAFSLGFTAESLIASVIAARKQCGNLPVLFAGGVMRDEIIRRRIAEKISDVYFGSTELSSDNAVGTAWLGLSALERRR